MAPVARRRATSGQNLCFGKTLVLRLHPAMNSSTHAWEKQPHWAEVPQRRRLEIDTD
eukprot:CAMPEP_0174364804 /NCGR_PEP_ID=MMETSP0811_2-20130205/74474_1 /TAXON_ID=73025 ORGANISM="Eutreptiella gymnastica-like, Strain CCMP1594" /NCGR_SAMPLE_ID=MMETSP0811_2 /ASSEMBLY_ACC=CAM_ASM_000667 /LENGTH=56 /DNA_ID=CAMNT_0015504823 /DNA_START=440 /DNA_END=607 /DNA_ORIENTATION=+